MSLLCYVLSAGERVELLMHKVCEATPMVVSLRTRWASSFTRQTVEALLSGFGGPSSTPGRRARRRGDVRPGGVYAHHPPGSTVIQAERCRFQVAVLAHTGAGHLAATGKQRSHRRIQIPRWRSRGFLRFAAECSRFVRRQEGKPATARRSSSSAVRWGSSSSP